VKCGVHNGDDILLMSTGCQLGNNAPIFGVNFLTGNDIGEDGSIGNDSGRRVIAGRFDTKNIG
jgi:hypothetical protein